MSTILKALRRLERERAKDSQRPLREEVVFARPRSRRPLGSWGLVAGALVLGFGVTWSVLPRSSEDGGREAPTSEAAAPLPSAMAPSPSLPPPVAARGAAAATPEPATPTSGAIPAPAADPWPPFDFSPPDLGSEPVETAGALPAAREPSPSWVIDAEPRAEVTAVRDDVVVVAPIEGRASRLVDEEPGPRHARAEIPVRVVRTSWHPRTERRSAWIAIGPAEPREVREGEWVGALEIRTIEPDGILFADGPLLVHRRIGER